MTLPPDSRPDAGRLPAGAVSAAPELMVPAAATEIQLFADDRTSAWSDRHRYGHRRPR